MAAMDDRVGRFWNQLLGQVGISVLAYADYSEPIIFPEKCVPISAF